MYLLRKCIREFKEITLWATFKCTPVYTHSFDPFDMPLDIPLERTKAGIHGLCISVHSFDLRCESVTCIYTLACLNVN